MKSTKERTDRETFSTHGMFSSVSRLSKSEIHKRTDRYKHSALIGCFLRSVDCERVKSTKERTDRETFSTHGMFPAVNRLSKPMLVMVMEPGSTPGRSTLSTVPGRSVMEERMLEGRAWLTTTRRRQSMANSMSTGLAPTAHHTHKHSLRPTA